MWPSGPFDASPNSPAGEIQGFAALADGLRRGDPRGRRAVGVLVIALVGLVLLVVAVWGVTALVH